LKENILAIGCDDGTLIICEIKGRNKRNNFEKKNAIICLDWDNHSPDYILIGHKNGEIFLIDSEKMTLLQTFEKITTGFFFI